MKDYAVELVSTVGMARDDWLEWRRKGIGGSDAAAVCGLSPWESPISVWLEKTGKAPPKDETESMRLGRDLEGYVVQRFTEATGITLEKREAILAHPDYPWMFANIDRQVVGENAGFEAKTANPMADDQWDEDKVPIQYRIQCLHYMAVTGADRWYIGCLILGKRFVWRCIERDEQAIADLIAIESEFWDRNVLGNVMPAPDGTDESQDAISVLFPAKSVRNDEEVALDDSEWDKKLDRLYELNDLASRVKKEQENIKQEFMLAMGQAAIARLPSNNIIKYKSFTQRRVDSDSLKKERPEIYMKYSKESATRRFEIPKRD